MSAMRTDAMSSLYSLTAEQKQLLHAIVTLKMIESKSSVLGIPSIHQKLLVEFLQQPANLLGVKLKRNTESKLNFALEYPKKI